MAPSEDLINFDVIETHKENIQSLPGGRSAKALVSTLAPFSPDPKLTATPSDTTNLNELARQEFEAELWSIAEADDPLDVYDRYVKWTLAAYPSAQATPQSRLLPLLERATKAFLSSTHYKNDPRYLKLWLHYIRLFSDNPRETFAFLARHHIGDGLALFYEEFAAWLETQGRWSQAEEVYRLGIDRDARPVERLARKLREFQERAGHRAQADDGPSSPALPTVRPALAAKIDPFASSSSPRRTDPQSTAAAPSTTSRRAVPTAPKLEIFTDGGAPPPASSLMETESTSQGWESIGSIAQRKKENVMEPRPWAGETLKAGGKKTGGAGKMMIFKDENVNSKSVNAEAMSRPSAALSNSHVIKRAAGKLERVYVDLDMLYPNPNDPTEEMSIEEVRASRRGWLNRQWPKEEMQKDARPCELFLDETARIYADVRPVQEDNHPVQEPDTAQLVMKESSGAARAGRSRKMGILEIRGETQTIKTNLDSPTKPKMRRKSLAEPTMTFHTRAATDEIYDIFNQPLHLSGALTEEAEVEGEGSDEEEDPYASGGETTAMTGRVSVTSHTGVGEAEEVTGSEWSEFTARKHIPDLEMLHAEDDGEAVANGVDTKLEMVTQGMEKVELTAETALITPISSDKPPLPAKSTFVPMPPDDYNYERLARCSFRDTSQAAQSRPPFMTPIVERTESSLAPSMANYQYQRDDDNLPTTTPSRGHEKIITSEEPDAADCDLMSSPFQELINEAVARHKQIATQPVLVEVEEQASPEDEDDALLEFSLVSERVSPEADHTDQDIPIINEEDCIPTDEHIRETILGKAQPSLVTFEGFFDHRESLRSSKTTEIRKYIKTIKASNAKQQDKHRSSSTARAPTLHFEGSDREYTIKKELGKGAFAPVYLVESTATAESDADEEEDTKEVNDRSMIVTQRSRQRSLLEAIKMEEPPSAWEFYIMRIAYNRLSSLSSPSHFTSSSSFSSATFHPSIPRSFIRAHELHLFRDECFLIEDYRSQGTLLDLINLAKSDSSSSSSSSTLSSSMNITAPGSNGMLNETLIVFFTVELMRIMEALHDQGIIHGDLKADNCLLRLDPAVVPTRRPPCHHQSRRRKHPPGSRAQCEEELEAGNCPGEDDAEDDDDEAEEDAGDGWSPIYSPSGTHGWSQKGISLIDFGRGIDMRCFHPHVQFHANWTANPEDCPEIKEGRPWTYQLDYFGLAGIVHTLLWGRYIDVVPINHHHHHHHHPSNQSLSGGTAITAGAGTAGSGGLRSTITTTNGNSTEGKDDKDSTQRCSNTKNEEGGVIKRYRLADKFKRYWQVHLWTEVFELLLNPLTYPSSSSSSSPSSASFTNIAPGQADKDEVGDGEGDAGEEDEEEMKLPRTKALRRVRGMLERWLVDHDAAAAAGRNGNGHGVGLKELLRRVEVRVGGAGGGRDRVK